MINYINIIALVKYLYLYLWYLVKRFINRDFISFNHPEYIHNFTYYHYHGQYFSIIYVSKYIINIIKKKLSDYISDD